MAHAEAAPARRIRKARGHGHERPREILKVAKDLFAAHGYENVTTRKIAERVGMSQAALYVYFANKEEIVGALRDQTFTTIVELIREVAQTTPPTVELLRAIARRYLQFAADHPQEYEIALLIGSKRVRSPQERDLDRPFSEQSIGRQCFVTFRDQIARLIAAGAIKRNDPTLVAQAIWMTLQGVCVMQISWPNFPWVERDRIVEATIDMIVDGVAA